MKQKAKKTKTKPSVETQGTVDTTPQLRANTARGMPFAHPQSRQGEVFKRWLNEGGKQGKQHGRRDVLRGIERLGFEEGRSEMRGGKEGRWGERADKGRKEKRGGRRKV